MSAIDDFSTAVQALAAALRAAADDPADQVRMLLTLADFRPASATGSSAIGQAMAAAETAVGDLCRRAALTQLARATADYAPRSYDEAVALRSVVCGLLATEELAAADAGQDATFEAFRAMRLAVWQDLTARGADLAPLRTVRALTPLPALAMAYRLWGDATRADELLGYSDSPNPLFVAGGFQAPTN